MTRSWPGKGCTPHRLHHLAAQLAAALAPAAPLPQPLLPCDEQLRWPPRPRPGQGPALPCPCRKAPLPYQLACTSTCRKVVMRPARHKIHSLHTREEEKFEGYNLVFINGGGGGGKH